MKTPFRIFPSTGYVNSQFQVLTFVENVELNIAINGQNINTIVLSKDNPAILSGLNKPGEYVATCTVAGEVHIQKIIVEDAIRLGSSILKTCYLFDNSPYTFFVMKDRLILYNESTNQIITENHISPSSIQQIDEENFLLITKIGENDEQICNLGIFNTTQLEITDELLERYQDIMISEDSRRIWLQEINSKDILCYSPSKTGKLNKIKEIKAVQNHILSPNKNKLIAEQQDSVSVINVLLFTKISEVKTDRLAVDKNGFFYGILNNEVYSYGLDSKKNNYFPLPQNGLNLSSDQLFYAGFDVTKSFINSEWDEKYDKLKQQVSSDKPSGNGYYRILLPEEEIIEINSFVDRFFSTDVGIYHFRTSTTKKLLGVTFRSRQEDWYPSEYESIKEEKNLFFHNSNGIQTMVPGKINSLFLKGPYLFTESYDNQRYYFENNLVLDFPARADLTDITTSTNNNYVLQKDGDFYSLYNLEKRKIPVLQNIQIHNKKFGDNLYLKQSIIWYAYKGENRLNAYDLLTDKHLILPQLMGNQDLFKIDSHYNFYPNYFSKHGSGILTHPLTGEVKDSVPGYVVAVSASLNKVVSRRNEEFYLSVFDNTSTKYAVRDVPLNIDTFSESYLSPDGRFLVLQKNTDNYHLYDIQSGEILKFFSGKFLSFSKEGNLIFEEDERRNAVVYDPNTFEKISSPNYHHYRFKSPDGKLYSQVASKVRYYNKIRKEDLTSEQVISFAKKINLPKSPNLNASEEEIRQYKSEERSIKNYRQVYYNTHALELNKLEIEKPDDLHSSIIIKKIKYTEIGIAGTTETVEVPFPDDLTYFNYAAFSYDNKYFGYVGKPSSDGLISLHKLNFDKKNSHLELGSTYQTREPDKATWICAFSRKGQFATYDSKPNTYLIDCNDSLFQQTEKNDFSKQPWDIRNGKSFLCFSPSGNFIALSDQGYNPLTLGGNGHKESSILQIGQDTSPEILRSFRDHGDKMMINRKKHIIFVAFAEDERKIMSLSQDGVVLVRNLDLSTNDNSENNDMV